MRFKVDDRVMSKKISLFHFIYFISLPLKEGLNEINR